MDNQAERTPFRKPKVLLVEGEDDGRFFSQLLKRFAIDQDFKIEEYGGRDRLRSILSGFTLRTGFSGLTAIGITRDADAQGTESALQSICTALYNAGSSESKNKIVPRKPGLRIDAHIVCDSNGKGRLEKMLLESVADNWRIPCMDDYWNCLKRGIPNDDELPGDENKARLAIFLASQHSLALQGAFLDGDDDYRLDHAVQRHYLNLDHPNIKAISDFLLSL